ncbi:Insulin-like growth factor binding protein, N-terminal [Pseudocohnilembus persalinus]|uniref:Insulin-like growth factor binding protein, N-terminal n=1 Tax=Pseudocohnilembus persalinus TaxID=266149 RepID=A0A0V0QYU0_PSEPJ|nr:Insulin-like growth factor binding protein, N-terminal [Pseudocohnilembus persalinus]|eukprot:KRX07463.1 Insulin-like growth factor binding protein, N-terminal [Pseudocohnilembus persalinus]
MISQFVLTVDSCHWSCKTCSGPDYNQCTSCPDNSIDYSLTYGICRCQNGYIAYENQCILTSLCLVGYQEDHYKKTCDKICEDINCLTCSQYDYCDTCQIGYKLLYGICVQNCPNHSTVSGDNCIYTITSSIANPIIASQQLMSDKFFHPQVKNLGWIPNKQSFSVASTYEWTNYAMQDCNGKSYAYGQNFYGGDCSDGCTFTNQINNLPSHYAYYFNIVLIYGDNWNNEDVSIKLDNVQQYQNTYTVDASSTTDICGSFDKKSDFIEDITIGPILHTDQTLDIEIKFTLDASLEDKWLGFREVSLILAQCMDVCATCSDDTTCDTCIDIRTNPPLCDFPSDGYFDDGSSNILKCDYKCATCDTTSDNCLTCTDPNSVPPNCGKYDSCFNWVKIDSGNFNKGSYHNQYINGIDQSFLTSLGLGFSVYDENGIFVEFQNFDTSTSYTQVQNMITFINNIPTNYFVNVGVFGDGGYELDPYAYDALQKLGLDSQTIINFGDGFAMMGIKDAAPGSQPQRINEVEDLNGNAIIEACMIVCDSLCASCSNTMDNCLTCSDTNHYLNDNGTVNTCILTCPSGKYPQEAPQKRCMDCPSECATCTQFTVCQTCNTGYYLYNNDCLANCPDGYYKDVPNKKCEPCDSTCYTCSGPSNLDCITCQTTPQHYYLTSQTRCYQNCPAKYYAEDSSNPKSCDQCHSNCVTCTSLSVCQTCEIGYQLISDFCYQICATNQYLDMSTDTCYNCDTACKTCTDSTNKDCITCQDTPQYYYLPDDNTCYLNCPSGYYKDLSINECVSCPIQCQACTDSSTCQSCNTGFFLDSSDNSCNTTCQDGYYGNTSNNQCDACDISCKNCNGSSDTDCTECSSPYFLVESQNKCYLTCPSGYQTNSSQKCEEICGDGLRIDLLTECDDGNTNDGDGCNKDCKIEKNWTCTGGNTSNSDTFFISQLDQR